MAMEATMNNTRNNQQVKGLGTDWRGHMPEESARGDDEAAGGFLGCHAVRRVSGAEVGRRYTHDVSAVEGSHIYKAQILP